MMNPLPENFEELPPSVQEEHIAIDADAEMNARTDWHMSGPHIFALLKTHGTQFFVEEDKDMIWEHLKDGARLMGWYELTYRHTIINKRPCVDTDPNMFYKYIVLSSLQTLLNAPAHDAFGVDEMYTMFDSGFGPHGVPDGWIATIEGRNIVIHSDLGGADMGRARWIMDPGHVYALHEQVKSGVVKDPYTLSDFLDETCERMEVTR
ncbi:MAG: hypothetical protein ACXABY_30930 [Candidatus Thorarchaeota archaeon]|jgi:hypothetical protein